MLSAMCIWAVVTLPKNPDDVAITVAMVVLVIGVSLFLPIFWQTILSSDIGKTCLSTPPQMRSVCLD
jgi:hypothetical protein